MSTPKKTNLATAITSRTELDLSCQHITTGNFMEFNVAHAVELVPRQTYEVTQNSFHRLEPLPVPTFGNADVHDRAYFVPFRTVMRGWNEFITDTIFIDSTGTSVIPSVPLINNTSFKSLFNRLLYSTIVSEDNLYDENNNPDGEKYDFVLYPPNSTIPQYRKFTVFGKYVYKLLLSLGYRIVFCNTSTDLMHSALPLLCLAKVYFDWYFPSAYVDDDRANGVRKFFAFDDYGTTTFEEFIDISDYDALFQEIWRVSYDSDYFVSAWDNPVAPNSGSYSNIVVSDITNDDSMPGYGVGEIANNSTNGTPLLNGTVSQYALDALKSVSDYMRRHQISGARVVERYLSRFGIQLDSAKIDRSLFIGELNNKIQFGDVTSTADTEGGNLGAYAGKGIAITQGEIVNFTADEYGMLFIVHSIVPKTAYYQGQNRMTYHISKFDFYTPEFDNLGVQALGTRELYVPTDVITNPNDLANGINVSEAVFGFVPRYAEYKRGYDNLTGDYVLPSKNAGKESWTLMRDVSRQFVNDLGQQIQYNNVHHDQNFVSARDALQYNRIFYVTDSNEDKFNIIHNFTIKSYFPGKSLYDSYEFKDEDKAAKVTVDVNGVKQN